MAVVVIPGCVQVSILGSQADGPFANVTHWVRVLSGSTPEDVAQAVLNRYVDDVLLRLTSTVSVAGAAYIDLSSSTGVTGTVSYTGTSPTSGTVTVKPAPPQVAYLGKFTSSGGRGSRAGRIFLPGVRSDEVNNDGTLTSGTITTIGDALNSWASAVSTDVEHVLCIAHKSGPLSGTSTTVSTITCEQSVATLRHRLRR